MYPFKYHRPQTLAEAKSLYVASDNASFLSGGHTLLPAMKLHLAGPSDLIDLGGIAEMRGVSIAGEQLSIGAATRHVEVSESPVVLEHIAALAGLAGSIGDRHVRHRGTIGGSIANNDPAADYPAAALGLGATIVTDTRQILADEFFTGLYTTALEPGEILTKIIIPIPISSGYAKFRSFASRYSIVGVFVARTHSGVRVAVTGAGGNGVFRAKTIEAALSRDFRPEVVADCIVNAGELMEDHNGPADYRAHLIKVMARRAAEHQGSVQTFK